VAQAKIWGVMGLLEGGQTGIALRQRSADALASTQARLEHAYALAELGAALRGAGQRSELRIPLRHALDIALRVHDELGAAGARTRREAVTGTGSLTPSEQRVSRLAAQQLTNNQIAQTLFVTPKTIEYHLRHVYQKLGITGRSELKCALVALRPA